MKNKESIGKEKSGVQQVSPFVRLPVVSFEFVFVAVAFFFIIVAALVFFFFPHLNMAGRIFLSLAAAAFSSAGFFAFVGKRLTQSRISTLIVIERCRFGRYNIVLKSDRVNDGFILVKAAKEIRQTIPALKKTGRVKWLTISTWIIDSAWFAHFSPSPNKVKRLHPLYTLLKRFFTLIAWKKQKRHTRAGRRNPWNSQWYKFTWVFDDISNSHSD